MHLGLQCGGGLGLDGDGLRHAGPGRRRSPGAWLNVSLEPTHHPYYSPGQVMSRLVCVMHGLLVGSYALTRRLGWCGSSWSWWASRSGLRAPVPVLAAHGVLLHGSNARLSACGASRHGSSSCWLVGARAASPLLVGSTRGIHRPKARLGSQDQALGSIAAWWVRTLSPGHGSASTRRSSWCCSSRSPAVWACGHGG